MNSIPSEIAGTQLTPPRQRMIGSGRHQHFFLPPRDHGDFAAGFGITHQTKIDLVGQNRGVHFLRPQVFDVS